MTLDITPKLMLEKWLLRENTFKLSKSISTISIFWAKNEGEKFKFNTWMGQHDSKVLVESDAHLDYLNLNERQIKIYFERKNNINYSVNKMKTPKRLVISDQQIPELAFPQDRIDHIFLIFWTKTNCKDKQFIWNWLGLAIVKQLVEQQRRLYYCTKWNEIQDLPFSLSWALKSIAVEEEITEDGT
jgi:signal transduction histidine kinase